MIMDFVAKIYEIALMHFNLVILSLKKVTFDCYSLINVSFQSVIFYRFKFRAEIKFVFTMKISEICSQSVIYYICVCDLCAIFLCHIHNSYFFLLLLGV